MGAMNPDAVHASQLFRLGENNIGERAELDEQPASRYGGHSGGCGERALGRAPVRVTLWSLSVMGAIEHASVATSSDCDSRDPGSRVRRIASMYHSDAELVDGDQEPADGIRLQRSVEQHSTLDNEVAPRCSATQSSNLTPQPTLDQREVQVAYRLALDQGEIIDRVVAGAERFDPDVVAERAEGIRDSATAFVNVHDDVHEPRMPRWVVQRCNASAPKLSTSDFAGSWK